MNQPPRVSIVASRSASIGLIGPSRADQQAMHIAVVEPYSWAWAALTLAEGAGNYVGGKAISRLLGEPSTEALIQRGVEELKKFIADTLDQRTIDECQAHINAVRRNLLAWENAPTTSGYRLDDADLESSKALSILERFGARSLHPYIDATSVRLLVLWARFKFFQERGELRNVIATVKEASRVASNALSKVPPQYDYDTPEVPPAEAECVSLGAGSNGRQEGICVGWYYDVDGVGHQCEEGNDQGHALSIAQRERRRYIESLGDRFETTWTDVHMPVNAIIAKWNQSAERASKEAGDITL